MAIHDLWLKTMEDMDNFYRDNVTQLKPVETLRKTSPLRCKIEWNVGPGGVLWIW
jgi:hypothetical protein